MIMQGVFIPSPGDCNSTERSRRMVVMAMTSYLSHKNPARDTKPAKGRPSVLAEEQVLRGVCKRRTVKEMRRDGSGSVWMCLSIRSRLIPSVHIVLIAGDTSPDYTKPHDTLATLLLLDSHTSPL
jgi:hypothetical protein